MEITEYVIQETKRVEKLFALKHKGGFKTKSDFANWFVATLKNQCYSYNYCGTSLFDINSLIQSGKLNVRRTGYGERGPILEIDKKMKGYKPDNCVIFCYYCIVIMARAIH